MARGRLRAQDRPKMKDKKKRPKADGER